MKQHFFLFLCFAFACICCGAAEIELIRDGAARCAVIRPPDASGAEIFAAKELAAGLKKVTGAEVKVLRRPNGSLRSIYLGTTGNPKFSLPENVRKLAQGIRDDGFALCFTEDALYVVANHRRGVLYGVYEILKRYGGFRWIHPGKDGEFYTKQSTFRVPCLAECVNPSFRWRRYNLIAASGSKDTPLWQVRNGMMPFTREKHLAPEIEGGGHLFSRLLPDSLFQTKPELFGLYGGKRMPQNDQENQPCTSNPETVRIMSENLAAHLRAHPEITYVTLFNNDSPKWCECENCRRLDPPEEAARKQVSTRYWTLVNQLIAAGKKAAPHVTFFGAGYQNYHEMPQGIAPSRDAVLLMAYNTRCYTHNLFDAACIRNLRFRRILEDYEKTGIPVTTYDYSNFLPCGKKDYYIPLARYTSRELKEYHRRGYLGWCDEVIPYDGTFLAGRDTKPWQKNCLDLYLKAYFLWNADADYETAEDDAGSRYYGKAWPAMRRYRKLLAELYETLNDHFWMGSSGVDLGKALMRPGAKERLEEDLKEAERLAGDDRRVGALVAKERELFRATYVDRNESFREKMKHATVAAAPSGKGLECGEHYADYLPEIPLAVRILYDTDALYFLHDGGGKGAVLEVTLNGKTTAFDVASAGRKKLLTAGIRPGGTMPLGVVFKKGDAVYGWNGKEALSSPLSLRLISFGSRPLIVNGSFEILKEEQGKTVADGFFGDYQIIRGNAFSGEISIRGRHVGTVLPHLAGYSQTYGVQKPFRGRLQCSVMVRGKGRLHVVLRDHLVPAGAAAGAAGHLEKTLDFPEWTPVDWVFDCGGFAGLYPLLLIHFDGLELDCLNFSKL